MVDNQPGRIQGVALAVGRGAAGGIVGGALVGLAEAAYLLTRSVPDLLSPLYAVVLYGLIGLPAGLVAGLVVGGAMAARGRSASVGLAWSAGLAAAASGLGLLILRYVLNRDLFAEQGVPMVANLAILAVVAVVWLVALLALRPAVSASPAVGGYKGLLGGWGGLVVLTGALSLVPVGGDARAAFASGRPIPEALAQRPNVLLIMVDTLRADHVAAYGRKKIATPNLDRLAADGVLFEHAYAPASWTRASIGSLFTSRYPSSHNADRKADVLPDEVVTFAENLQPAGVTTGALVNNINVTATFHFDQGFDTFLYEAPAYRFGATESVFGLSMYKVVHKVAERLSKGSKPVTSYYQPADVVLGDALAFADANASSRWALFVHLMEPHDPYFEHPFLRGEGDAEYNGKGFARAEVEHPDPADAAYLRQVYAQEVVFLDLELGRFIEALEARGLYDSTAILLTADHGEEFFEHGGWWHGTTLYEEQIDIPLLIKPPGKAWAGRRADWTVSTVDLAPTISALLGVAPDPSWQGRDLLDPSDWAAALAPEPTPDPVDEGDATPAPVPVDPCAAGISSRNPLDRLIYAEEDFEGNQVQALIRDRFKRIVANEGNPRGLPTEVTYDLLGDVAEQNPLVDGTVRCAEVAVLKGQLAQELDTVRERATSGQAAEVHQATTSAADKCSLCALGYLSGPECDGC